MKRLLLVLLAALSFNSLALDATTLLTPTPLGFVLSVRTYFKEQTRVYYIRVESRAKDFEQAKKQAFRLASEQVVGTLVLSESELRNSNLTRDEIITYSSGIVDEYKIVDRVDGPGYVKLTVDVWIAENAMAQRLLAKSSTNKEINGDALSARMSSILEEQTRGDDVFLTVLKDYPKRSYVIKITSTNTSMDALRNVNTTVNWTLAWDQRFTNAFFEAAKATGQKVCVTWGCPKVESRIQGFTYSDNVKTSIIADFFNMSGATVMVELQNIHRQPVARTCDVLHGQGLNTVMLASGPNGTVLNVDQKLAGSAILALGQNTAKIADLSSIQVQVVPNRQCKALYNPV